MQVLTLLLANPGWRRWRAGDADLLTTSPTAEGTHQLTHPEDGVTIRLHAGDGAIRRFELFRSVTTSDQLYVYAGARGITVSDQFAWIVNQIPVAERHLSQDAVLDHFLFRTTPGEGTYLERVRRVGNGSLLSWSASAGFKSTVVDRITRPAYAGRSAAAGMLGHHLSQRLNQAPRGTRNLLSGGIDSSLLQSFAAGQMQAVSATIDSPEFALEQSYARAAAALFGLAHEFVEIRETEYPQHVRDVIRRTGMPPHHLQTVLIDAAFSSESGSYVSAQFADALFGLDAAYRAWRIQRFGVARMMPLLRLASLMPWKRLARLGRSMRRDVGRLRLPLESPDGFGMQFAVYSDVAALRAMFGASAVNERLVRRMTYVEDRVDPYDRAAPHFAQQLELGHWIDFFCDDSVAIWRQCAHSRGSRLLAPFSDRAVVEAALLIRPQHRFCVDGRTKPLLKDLLLARVPSYPVRQPKGGSGLPVHRYLTTGPLRAEAEEALASDWPLPLRSLGSAPTDWLLWNQITLRLWEEEVRCRRSTTPEPAVFLELPVGSVD